MRYTKEDQRSFQYDDPILKLEKIMFLLFICLIIYLHKNNFFLQRYSRLCYKILFGRWNLGPGR